MVDPYWAVQARTRYLRALLLELSDGSRTDAEIRDRTALHGFGRFETALAMRALRAAGAVG